MRAAVEAGRRHHQRRARACASRARSPRPRRRRRRVSHAHAGRAAHDAGRAALRRTSSPKCAAFSPSASRACRAAGIDACAARDRSGLRIRQAHRRQSRAAQVSRAADRPRRTGCRRTLAQVDAGEAHGTRRGRQNRRAASRSPPLRFSTERVSCAPTTWPPRSTPCALPRRWPREKHSMARKYFGTDGVRGRVGEHPMTVDFALRLASAAARVLAPQGGTVLIGKDTRLSGYMFEAALEAGFVAAGVNVMLIGPLPTPGIAYLDAQVRVQLRRRHQRLSQSLRRQRHQVLRRRGRQAVRRDRRADRGRARERPDHAFVGRSSVAHRASTSRAVSIRTSARNRCRRASTLEGLKLVVDCGERRGLQGRAAHARGPRRGDHPDRLLAERSQHQRRLRFDRARPAAADGARRACGRRHRARWRRRSPGHGRWPRARHRRRPAHLHHRVRAQTRGHAAGSRRRAPS